jgi:hypothetical protein
MFKRVYNGWSLAILAVASLLISGICFAVLIAGYKTMPTGGIVTLIACGIAALGVIVIIGIYTIGNAPSYYTKHDVAVWTNGINQITKDLMEAALDTYIERVCLHRPDIKKEALLDMYSRMMVVWFTDTVGAVGIGYSLHDKEGLRGGYVIHLHWTGSVTSSALFHEVHHMVDDVILHKPSDYQHTDKAWWTVIGE